MSDEAVRKAAKALITEWYKDVEGSVNGYAKVPARLLRELSAALDSDPIPAVAVQCLTCGRVNGGPHACPGFAAGPAYGGSPRNGVRGGESWPPQTEFDVVLTAFPADKKIAVLKAIRIEFNLPLPQAMEIVGKLPHAVVNGVSKWVAEDIVKKLRDAGATVEIR